MAASATMDFFQHQVAARKKTSVLIALYVLAVILIIAAVYAAFMAIFAGASAYTNSDIGFLGFWNPEVFAWVIGITVLIVALGTTYKVVQLSAGGEAVARLLGGRPIEPSTRQVEERRILNVVEEMAIASGVPVPRVYVLDNEEGINAFAAGFGTADAVIAVTRGCILRMNRSELQGVIAHEFSHLLNGDMRMNLRLLGILHGILVLGLVGFWVMRIGLRMLQGRGRSKGKAAVIPFILFGLLVWLIGYIGVLFGRLIKSAVSRQREFLADASAVQFTRDPTAIAGALKKIAGLKRGSRLADSHAEEASHLFFANGVASPWFSLLATHPPIDERIRRIDPSFDGTIEEVPDAVADDSTEDVREFVTSRRPAAGPPPLPPAATVGQPTAAHLDYVGVLLASLPPGIDSAVRTPPAAAATIYALLLSADSRTRDAQLQALGAVNAGTRDEFARVLPLVDSLDPMARMPVADLAVSGMRSATPEQYAEFRETVTQLASADRQIDLFEFTLQRMVLRRLEPVFGKTRRPTVQYYDLTPLLPACRSILSCIAYWGADETAQAHTAFAAGVARLPGGEALEILPLDGCGLDTVDEALSRLVEASPQIKKVIVNACEACVFADREVTAEEGQLLRAVADSLDCPMPPILPGMPTSTPVPA